MKRFIIISLLLFILIMLLVPTLASDGVEWKGKLGNDLREKLGAKKFSITQLINPEKVNVIIFTDDKESIKYIGKTKYEFQIIPAVATEIPISKIESIAKLETTKKILLDYPVKAFRVESIPLIRADTASSTFAVNGTGINVSIVDTGIFNHTEFQSPNRIILQKCYCVGCCPPNNVNESNNATDDNGHGTHVAGIAAGKGDSSYGKGVATNASLFAVKVLDSTGSGGESDIIKGIEWAVENNAQIISLSLGIAYDYFTNCYDRPLSQAVDNATQQGVVVVVAAGNCGPEGSTDPNICPVRGNKTIAAPGCAKTALTVGASNDIDSVAGFSSRGPTFDNRTKPDLLAPGVSITSTDNSSTGYAIKSGTSQATPHVTGVVALLIQKYNKTFGYFPEPGRVKAILLTAVNTSKMQQDGYPQRNNVYGAGRIDAYEVLRIINFTKNDTIFQGEQKFYLINTTNTSLKVTIVWMENSTINNNLDLIVGNSTNNFTYPTDANDTVEQVFLYNINPGIWRVFVNGTKVTGQQKFFLASDSVITSDTIPPKWSNVNFNQTAERGEKMNISVYWTDESILSQAFLSTNETSEWRNYTDLSISLAGYSAWSNFTWVNSSLANGTMVLWKIYANDTFGNVNVTQEFNFTVIDTKGPKYFNLTNTTDSIYSEGKVYWFNITFFDYSGIDNVVFEWDGLENVSNVTTYDTINETTRKYYINKTDLPVGNYTYRWFVNDTLNNWNSTLPQVYNVTPAPTSISLWLNGTQNNKTYDRGAIANITAQVNVSSLNVTIATNYTGTSVDIINSTFTATNMTNTSNLDIGVYNITAYYNGYDLNYSASYRTYFLIVREAYRNNSVNISNNTLTLINASNVNITLQILTNDTLTNEKLNITLGKDNPVWVYPQAIGINRYISIEAGVNLTTNLTYAIINVSYLDSDIPNSIDENSLRLYRWNSSDWVKYDEPNGGVNTTAKYVWANSTTFSNFTIAGLLANGQSCTSDYYCSSGYCVHGYCRPSATYCGDGYCDPGESYSNCPVDCPAPAPSRVVGPITVQEITVKTSDTQANITIPSITSGKITNVSVSKTFLIRNLSIKTNATLSNVKIKIEKTSKPIEIISPRGISYEYFEIQGKNIDDSKIDFIKLKFAVNKSWINVNEINESTITLNRYKEGWEKLNTSKVSEEITEIIYEATPKGLSLFAITGEVIEKKVCPVCPEPGNWSTCVNDTQTRTNYKCSSETNYRCQAYNETRACEIEKPEGEKRRLPIKWLVIGVLLIAVILTGILIWRKSRRWERLYKKYESIPK